MSIEIQKQQESLTLAFSGRLTGEECDSLRHSVAQNLTPAMKALYLDFARLTFIDSAGLGALIGVKIAAQRQNARTIILSPQPEVLRTLLSVQFDCVFTIVEQRANPLHPHHPNSPHPVPEFA